MKKVLVVVPHKPQSLLCFFFLRCPWEMMMLNLVAAYTLSVNQNVYLTFPKPKIDDCRADKLKDRAEPMMGR